MKRICYYDIKYQHCEKNSKKIYHMYVATDMRITDKFTPIKLYNFLVNISRNMVYLTQSKKYLDIYSILIDKRNKLLSIQKIPSDMFIDILHKMKNNDRYIFAEIYKNLQCELCNNYITSEIDLPQSMVVPAYRASEILSIIKDHFKNNKNYDLKNMKISIEEDRASYYRIQFLDTSNF